MQLGIHDLEVAGGGDVPGTDPSLAGDLKTHLARPIRLGAYANPLDVQEELHHFLLHTRDGGVLVDDIVNLDPGDGAAIGGAEQDPAQGISNGQPKPTLQRLHSHFAVGIVRLQDMNVRDYGLGCTLNGWRRNKISFQHGICYLE